MIDDTYPDALAAWESEGGAPFTIEATEGAHRERRGLPITAAPRVQVWVRPACCAPDMCPRCMGLPGEREHSAWPEAAA